MNSGRGRNLPLSLPRRWIGDMLHFAQRVPIVAGERVLRIRPLVEVKRASHHAPSWYASIVKAFGIVSDRIPELRRAYIPHPTPRLYEHPHSVASIVIDRLWNDEHATFLCPMLYPERLPLTKIHDKLRGFHNDPIERHGPLRRLVRTSRYPRLIRRLIWELGLNWSGDWRARHFGTYAVNSVAGLRGRIIQFVTPITSVLYFGSVSATGEMTVQIAFDHRVFDGYTAGRAMGELESVLNTEIATEYRHHKLAAA